MTFMYCFSMKNFLIGNSIVRDVVGSQWETICLPGVGWKQVIDYVLDRKERFRDSFVYIHVGPVRFSRLHRAANRREAQLLTTGVGTVRSNFDRWDHRLCSLNIYPVLCTIYPMDFKAYNDHLAASLPGGHGRQILTAFYAENSQLIKGMVVEENREITAFNDSHGLCTPFLHRTIFKRNRGYYRFRPRFLKDGLHPTREIVRRWVKELREIVQLNNAKWSHL